MDRETAELCANLQPIRVQSLGQPSPMLGQRLRRWMSELIGSRGDRTIKIVFNFPRSKHAGRQTEARPDASRIVTEVDDHNRLSPRSR